MTFGCIVNAIQCKNVKNLHLHLHNYFSKSGTIQKVGANLRYLFSLSEFPSVYSIVCGRQPEIYHQKLFTELFAFHPEQVIDITILEKLVRAKNNIYI